MKQNKYISRFFASIVVCGSLLMNTSCTKGLVEDDIPFEVKNTLDVNTFYAQSRYLLENKVCAINYPDQPMQSIILMVTALNNNASSVANAWELVAEQGVPEDTIIRATINILDSVELTTPNLGWLFVKSAFNGDAIQPSFININGSGMSNKIKMPVDIKNLVVSFTFNGDYYGNYNCEVKECLDGAPTLGIPGDFSTPHRYLLRNPYDRGNGLGHRERVLEIRVQYASHPIY